MSRTTRREPRKPRDWNAVAIFKKGGAHKDKRKEESKNSCRKWKSEN